MSRLCSLLSCGLAVLLAGCGTGGTALPEHLQNLQPVMVKVTQAGTPVSGATVTFLPVNDSGDARVGSGQTDAEGNCELYSAIAGASAAQSKGLVPGEYRVIISLIKMKDGSPVPAGTSEMDALAEGGKETLAPKFSDFERSTLTATVVAGDGPQELPFDVGTK